MPPANSATRERARSTIASARLHDLARRHLRRRRLVDLGVGSARRGPRSRHSAPSSARFTEHEADRFANSTPSTLGSAVRRWLPLAAPGCNLKLRSGVLDLCMYLGPTTLILIAACSGNAAHPVVNRSHTRGDVISTCNRHFAEAKHQYEVQSSSSGEVLTIRMLEATLWGHHGEPPSVTFTIGGEFNSMSLVWFQGRSSPTRAWVSDEQARFLGSSRRGASALMWGSEDRRWRAFAAAFRPAADACLTAFEEQSAPGLQ